MAKKGPTHRLTVRERWKVVDTYMISKSLKGTARACDCSVRTVKRWARHYQVTNTVDNKPKSGRRPSLTPALAAEALNLLSSGQFSGAGHVASFMREQSMTPILIGRSTIIRHARAAAERSGRFLRVRRGKPKKGLSEATVKKRLDFAKDKEDYPWHLVMFSDRKRFHFRYPGSIVRMTRWSVVSSKSEEEEGVYQPNNPNCFNVYVGITVHGATTVHEVAGSTSFKHQFTNKKGEKAKNITTDQYKAVLQETLLKQGSKLFGGASWIFQQDNDPTHKIAASVIDEWNNGTEANVELLQGWPPSSPDLNIIENFWSYIDEKVAAAGCKTLEEFKEYITNLVNSRSPCMLKYLARLYASVSKRITKLLQVGGKKIPY